MTDSLRTQAAQVPVTAPQPDGQRTRVQPVGQIEAAVSSRTSDAPLTNWWLAVLLLNPVTLGIYALVLFFRRINRIDAYIARKQPYYAGLVEYTTRYARDREQLEAVRSDLDALDREVQAFPQRIQPIGAGRSFLLILVTFGVWGYVVLYRMNRAWDTLQLVERDFDERLSAAWQRLGLIRSPIGFTIDPSKHRNFARCLVLSVVTLGIWGAVWDHRIHTDPDSLFPQLQDRKSVV